MKRYLFILLLFITQTLASNELTEIKLRAKQKNNGVDVRFVLKTNIINPEQAKKFNTTPYYISSVTAQLGNELIYTAYLGPYLANNAFLKFIYNGIGSSNILNLSVVDSNGKKIEKSTQIKNSSNSNDSNKSINESTVPNLDVWQETNSDDAINKLYGSTETIEGNFTIMLKGDHLITLDDGICTGNAARINLAIQSNINLRSLAIFQDANPYSTIAVFNTYKNPISVYQLTFKMKNTSLIRVVGKGADGLLYESKYKVYVIPSSHRDCYGNVSGPYMDY